MDAVYFLIAISLLVTVHELGHFLAARLCGVKVLRFSLGFGCALKTWRYGPDQTEWVLSLIPLGGYVKMLDEREGEVAQFERHRCFNTQPLYRRSFIVFAGPLANLLLAVVLYWGVACAGVPDLPAVLGKIDPGSRAAHAGLIEGDRVIRVSGAQVRGWGELRWQVIGRSFDKGTVSVDVMRGGTALSGLALSLGKLEIDEKGADPLAQLGIVLPEFQLDPVTGTPSPGSPAERAGFRDGDVIRKVGVHEITRWNEFVDYVQASPGRQLSIEIERGSKRLVLYVTPENIPGQAHKGRIGVPVRSSNHAGIEIQYGVIDGLGYGMQRTWSTAILSLRAMWHIVIGDLSARNISGPVSIADYAGRSASAGLDVYVQFLAMVSVSLGVLNLLPVPILDGGHLLYHAAELIRGGPLPERVEVLGQQVGMVLLACLMALALFNDFNRVFG